MGWLIQELGGWYADSPFSTATWADWVDIVLLTWLIYTGLMLIRGTRALQTLLGLVILAVIYLLADEIRLTSLHWLLDHLFVYVVLALLILFQEDIRRALARAGSPLMPRTSRPSDANLREEVIQAVFALAHRKVGALIAIQRTASLEPYTEGAHQLDAEVSMELIQAIFHPSSPIHDGALVIAHDRMVAAGVFLPISTSKHVMRSFGTRHRAAIGLSEDVDAVTVVVSEERGTVSLVMDGNVIPVVDPDDLRERLQEALERGADPAVQQLAAGRSRG